MSDLFLEREDVETLTGRKRPSGQIAWLRERGYAHDVNDAGRPVVMIAEAERHLVSRVARRRQDEPNWSALKRSA